MAHIVLQAARQRMAAFPFAIWTQIGYLVLAAREPDAHPSRRESNGIFRNGFSHRAGDRGDSEGLGWDLESRGVELRQRDGDINLTVHDTQNIGRRAGYGRHTKTRGGKAGRTQGVETFIGSSGTLHPGERRVCQDARIQQHDPERRAPYNA